MQSLKYKILFFIFLFLFSSIIIESFSYLVLTRADQKNGFIPLKPNKMTLKKNFVKEIDPFIFTGAKFDPQTGWESLQGELRPHYAQTRDQIIKTMALASSYGDSFTYCAELSFSQTWQHQAAQLMKQSFLNLGVRGCGPDQAYIKFKKYNKKYPAHIVIIGVLPEAARKVVSRVRNYYFSDPCRPLCKTRFIIDSFDRGNGTFKNTSRDSSADTINNKITDTITDAVTNLNFIPNMNLALDPFRPGNLKSSPKMRLLGLPYSGPDNYASILNPAYLTQISLLDGWYNIVKKRFGLDLVQGRTFPFTDDLARYLYTTLTAGPGLNDFHWRRVYPQNMSDNTVTPQSEAFIIVKSLFLNFLNDSRAKEFVPLIVHHCHKDEIISGQAYIEPFESFLKQKGLNVINIQKILSNEIKAGHITAEELFLKGNGHYTWLANQIIGYKIMPFLLALKDQHKRVKDYLKFKSLKQDSLVIDFDFSVLLPDYKSIFFRCGLDKLLKEDFQSARAYLSRALKYFNSSNRSNTLNTKISDTNLSDTNLSGINHKIDYNTACLIDEFAKKAGINIKDFFYETDYYEESKISVMNMIKKAFPWIEKNQIKDKIKDTNNIKNKNQIKDTNNIKDKRKENNNNLITTLYDLFIKEQALLNKAQTSGPFNNSIKTKTALVQAKRAFFLLTAPDNDLVRPWHALELASRAASALNYTDPKVNLVMSMAYFKLNRFDESSETARAALAVLDKNKHNDSQLIKALEFLINTKKALNWSEDIFSESLFNQAYTQAFSGE